MNLPKQPDARKSSLYFGKLNGRLKNLTGFGNLLGFGSVFDNQGVKQDIYG